MAPSTVEALRDRIRALPAGVRGVLDRYGFDLDGFLRIVERWRSGDLARDAGPPAASIRALGDDRIERLHAEGTSAFAEAESAGWDAIRSGRVGALILNGGMATRFGGRVKGAAQAHAGRSFLDLKLAQIRGLGAPVPAFVMNSFATDAATLAHLEAIGALDFVRCFTQGVAVRLTPQGDVFFDPDDPQATLYAPGHGDVPSALRASGLLDRFVAGGGQWLLISNVDNVGATVDPAVVGQAILSGVRLTAEVAERLPGDSGGLPAEVSGRVQILESFRFPQGFDDSPIRWFNTNTFLVDVAVLLADHRLTWLAVNKKVGEKPVVQFERLVGELSAFEEPLLLGVPRSGARSRFLPIKTPEDLAASAEAVAEVVASWGR